MKLKATKRNHPSIPVLCLVTVAAISLSAGCSSNKLGRVAVSGNVKFQGKPLEKGTIDFRPVPGSKSVSSGAPITRGAYQIDTLRGLPPGKYEVRIFSSKDVPPPKDAPPGGGNPPAVELIPPEYNIQTTQIVEVTAAGPNHFDFDISAK
jgi:hypothetical protein